MLLYRKERIEIDAMDRYGVLSYETYCPQTLCFIPNNLSAKHNPILSSKSNNYKSYCGFSSYLLTLNGGYPF